MVSTRQLCALLTSLYALPASAAVFTVGPHGATTSLQAAIDTARSQAGSHEIRVEEGTYGAVSIPSLSNSISILGGWNATFSARTTDAAKTVLSGNDQEVVFRIDVTAASSSLTLDGLTLTKGFSDERAVAGGLHAANINGALVLNNLRVVANHSEDLSGTESGPGGISLRNLGQGQIQLTNSSISNNRVSSPAGADGRCFGGGLLVSVRGGPIVIRGNQIRSNRIDSSCSSAEGLGAWLSTDTNLLTFEDNVIRGNESTTAFGLVLEGRAFGGTARLDLRRNRLLDNRDASKANNSRQVSLFAKDGARIFFTDNLLAASPSIGAGVQVSNGSGGILRLTNNTIANHKFTGASLCNVDGNVSFANGIVVQQPTNVVVCSGSDPVNQPANQIGGDAKFRNPNQLDYRLKASSPAINKGSNTPPGGLGPFDLAGGPRKKGPKVDRGAYEYP